MKRLIFSALMLAATVGTAAAQSWDVGGIMIDPAAVTAMDMFNWSQTSMGVGTARSTAMGGAMTSLGGDISAMSVNPAGLGMYRQNDVALTPMIGVARTHTADTGAFEGDGSTRFSIANFGVVFKAYEGTGKVVAVNLGFGYNRVADFNSRTSFSRMGNASSIAEAFARQLTNSGLTSDNLHGDGFDWFKVGDPVNWGPTLGYQCWLVNDESGEWRPDGMLDEVSSVDHYATLVSRGGIGEYTFSAGMNIDNKFYMGLTMGILNLSQRREYYYGEEYVYDAEPAGEHLNYMNYTQTQIINGTGLNFKFGLTYRPIEALRIGVAVHTPTWYTVDCKYSAGMHSNEYLFNEEKTILELRNSYEDTDTWVDNGVNSWHFRTPVKLLAGISYTIGQRAIISADYERTWYNTLRSQNTPVGHGVYNDFFRQEFRGANTFRAGAEFKALSYLALRAGYGFHGSMVKDNKTIYSSPVNYNTQYVSAGVGFVLSNSFYLDIAYRYFMQRQTTAMLFYAYDAEDKAPESRSGEYTTRLNRHDILLTLGFRF